MFITFEGIEGAGKGTLITYVAEWLASRNIAHVCTREPGGSELGKQLRSLLLNTNARLTADAEMFLYLADRAQHVEEIVRPALARGDVVICDRYADSNIVYQGYGRGLDVEELYAFNKRAVRGLWPDITFLLDLSPEVGLARARSRNAQLKMAEQEGRFEAEDMRFHTQIRMGFLTWAERHPTRFHIIDAGVSPEKVWDQVRSVLEEKCL